LVAIKFWQKLFKINYLITTNTLTVDDEKQRLMTKSGPLMRQYDAHFISPSALIATVPNSATALVAMAFNASLCPHLSQSASHAPRNVRQKPPVSRVLAFALANTAGEFPA
jgi:hypothetical protein